MSVVVVGVLIAFFLNNWNEGLKKRRDEINTLINFKESLQNDLPDFQLPLRANQKQSQSLEILLKSLETDVPYHDSLQYHFGNAAVLWASHIK